MTKMVAMNLAAITTLLTFLTGMNVQRQYVIAFTPSTSITSHPNVALTTVTTTKKLTSSLNAIGNPFDALTGLFQNSSKDASDNNRFLPDIKRQMKARDLIVDLIEEDKCFSTEEGARAFGNACATNVVYEDRFEAQPLVGRVAVTNHFVERAKSRSSRGGEVRIDKISDGNAACGFAWTWTCGDLEGLRGTTFVELNDEGEIVFVREIPEPIYKPGDLTLEILKAVTADAEPEEPKEYVERVPVTASDMVKYLFEEVQGQNPDVAMKLFSEKAIYRDFNYEDVLTGKTEIRKFIEDFSFPGITFRPQRYDDGVNSSCFTWEVVLMDAPDTIKGISFYELDPVTKLITYVRDVPESALKPPPLGKIARQIRPALGVFQAVKKGSRADGM